MPLANMFRNEPDIVLYADGDVVFSEGDPSDNAMFVVIEGAVAIRINGENIDLANPGDIVGEMALVDQSPRSATIVAVGSARLARIDRRRFLYLIQNTPTFAIEVMHVMADRLRRANAARERHGAPTTTA